MLDQLQNSDFRRDLADLYFCKSIEDQMVLHWTSYLYRRNKIMEAHIQSVPLIKENATESAEIVDSINSQNLNPFNEASN